MKVLFSADWHIKLGQKNVPKDWQIARYRKLFKKLHELEKEVDIVILGGDIFDKLPNTEELSLYFEYLVDIEKPTFIYDGNHEATKKRHTFLRHLEIATNKINNNAHIVNGIAEIKCIDIIPYTHIKNFNPKDFHNDILCTHVRGSIPPHVVPEIDLSLLDRWKTVLAGDLHAYENSQRNILYPGSPLSITFHRSPVKNGVIIFDTITHEHEWVELGLPQLIRKTVDKESDIIQTIYDHTIYEVTGNLLELSSIDTTSLIVDKKVVNKSTEAKLNLKDLDLKGELYIYLEQVLNLSKKEIDDTLKVFNDYSTLFDLG